MTGPEAPKWTPLLVPSTGNVSALGKGHKGTPGALWTDPPSLRAEPPGPLGPCAAMTLPAGAATGQTDSPPLRFIHRARRLAPT